MKWTIDFETRSELILGDVGAWKYAAHPSTEVMCLAGQPGHGSPVIWIPDKFSEILGVEALNLPLTGAETFRSLPLDPSVIFEAHNAEFERAIWMMILHRRHGWPDLPLEQVRCSAAKAATCGLPRKLSDLAKALNLEEQKDSSGHTVMLQTCKPRPARKAEKQADPDWENRVYWYDDPARLMKLYRYCIQDVKTEYQVSEFLPDLSPYEQKIWEMDQRINMRGVHIDRQACEAMVHLIENPIKDARAEFKALVNYPGLEKPSQVKKFQEWLRTQGVHLPSLGRAILEEYLEQESPGPVVRRALEIRLAVSGAAAKKYKALLAGADGDDRVRGAFMYHQASPGRWSSKRAQFHNMKSRDLCADPEQAVLDIKGGMPAWMVEKIHGPVVWVAGSCVRPCITAASGNEFCVADYNAIEGRGLAWLAGEDWVLNEYRLGRNMYFVNTMKIYNMAYEEISKGTPEYDAGKVAELAFGFAGGWRAAHSMAKNLKVTPPRDILETAEALWLNQRCIPITGLEDVAPIAVEGISLKPEKIRELGLTSAEELAYYLWFDPIVKIWRKSRPATKALWYQTEEAAVSAVLTPGTVFTYRKVSYYYDKKKDFLMAQLPSGRLLYYYQPRVKQAKTPWGKLKLQLSYMGMRQTKDKTSAHWTRVFTRGGKLVENNTQAICRDILADALLRLESRGYPPVLHVHDEPGVELPKGTGSLEVMIDIMCEPIPWAPDFPLKASGWVGKRYKK